ncbi:hypothetical protein KVR01_001041 [Diaporthe batatas]|uniref:uncharacterized protein n=1 Tax=Diaporthe batatas TaxID=748121 RepID=UPI001D04F8DB|nr:uncharacterized protein KVR01_001041 [Diaporthe batatas]KAG8170296.1 hypothetical protein KVR01_001041 [Diaporthe batatas]
MPASVPTERQAAKERGCFQCSKRRITCDRAEPSCGKCIKKGLDCSGLARIRFNEGVARRGRLKNCTVPVPDIISQHGETHCQLPTVVTFPELQWHPHDPPRTTQTRKVRTTKRRPRPAPYPQRAVVDQPAAIQCLPSDPPLADCPVIPPADGSGGAEGDYRAQYIPPTEAETGDEEIDASFPAIVHEQPNHYMSQFHTIMPWIAPLPSETRGLFHHFSEAVAPVMVILDKVSNGYREFILPMALQDEVLCRAISVVAAQHLSQGNPALELAADKGRTAVISRLRKDALLESQVFNEHTWATLLVLLVGETVTGNADYSFLVQMLLCLASNNIIRNKQSRLTRFLKAQTHMFTMLGQPFLEEEGGVRFIQQTFNGCTDWLSCEELPPDCQDRRNVILIRQCFAEACNIYLGRATTDHEQDLAIKRLMQLLSQVDSDAPTAHALVWVCFIAGAETNDPQQRDFFVTRMNETYQRTRFRNIPAAVQSLQRIWKRKAGQKWTSCLPELTQVLVM